MNWLPDRSEQERMFRIGCAIQAQSDLECAREFDVEAHEAEAAGFPDVAEEARAEAYEARQDAARFRGWAQGG